MFKVALKALAGHKLRFALTAAAVVIGVAAVSGAFVFTDSIDEAFGSLLETAYEGSDVEVRAASEIEGSVTMDVPGQGPTLDEAVVAEVEAVEGVEAAYGYIEGTATLIDAVGESLGNPQAPGLAFSWGGEPSPLTLREGRVAEGPDEVTIDAGSFETGGFELGDQIQVLLPETVETFEIVGVTGFGEADNLMGATLTTFDPETAQRVFDKEGRADSIAVVAAEGVDATVLRDRIAAELGDDVRVATTADEVATQQAEVSEALGFVQTFLLVIAAVMLFVASFIIVNTFSIVVAQRSREFALLRAVGASSRQVRTAVLFEAAVVGVVAATIGLFGGFVVAEGIKGLMAAVGLDMPSGSMTLAPRTVIAAYVVGVGVTVVASFLPARRASRVAPVEAMRGAAPGAEPSLRRRTVVGTVLAVVGATLLATGLFAEVDNAMSLVGAGALATMLGVTLLAPLLAGPVARALGVLPARMGISGRLAQRNALRNRRRTAATASALMIGLALLSFVTIIAASLRATLSDLLAEQFRADFVISNASMGIRGLPSDVVELLADRDELATATSVAWTQWSDGESERFVAGVDPAVIDDVVVLEADADPATVLAGDAVMVQTDALADLGLEVGDTLPMTFATRADVPMTIVASFENSDLVGSPFLVERQQLEEYAGDLSDAIVYANAAGDLSAARSAVDEVVAGFPGLTAQDQAEFREQQDQMVNQILGLMMGLLFLAVIIAVLGIINTLVLSVFERTKEIGLLRAVGMTRRQTRRMVRWESVLVSLFGAVLGLVVGTLLSWAVIRALAEEGFERLVIPGGQLVLYFLVAAIVGVIAGAFPARRAARLDVLRAVTAE